MAHNVAFLAPVPTFKGGAERCLFDVMRNPDVTPLLIVPAAGPLSEQAAREGIPFQVLDFGEVAALRRPIRPAGVGAAASDWLRAAHGLNALVRETGVDLVHSNGMKAHCIAALARRIGGAPTVVHLHDIALRRTERMVWKGLARAADRMIVVSRACWPDQHLPDKVSVVFNAVEPGITQLPPRTPDGRLVVGICGRIHPFKGHHVALEWLHAARAAGLDVVFRIRGEAAAEDRNYQEGLQRTVMRLGLEDAVAFEGRFDSLPAIYGGLDAVLVPSDTPDPLPRSVMEAMGLGLPVVGFPAGGIVEMIDPGQTGWLAADAQAFCAAARAIAALGPQLPAFRQRLADTVSDRFGMQRMHRQISGIYAGMLGR
ncbi:glycosyltransferase family 4 protein [Sphingomonas azotifigens]|uniref:glycosyltransferase family 4 protein n=1 Tax=Sphingomonas azotifigens TaxID=330920 RepID=UPI000A050B96|nr:glycosyltransferase family 4 protein [Sphingomonas azotifigens]